MRNNGGINVGNAMATEFICRFTYSGMVFESNLRSSFVEIETIDGKTEVVKVGPSTRLRTPGDLQRFAVEWYYKNIYHQNFGGREMAPYEVVLKNY